MSLGKITVQEMIKFDANDNDNENMQRKSDFTERSEADVYST